MAEYTDMRYDPERDKRRKRARDRAIGDMTKPPVPPSNSPNLNPPMRNLPYRPPTQTPMPGPVANPPVMRPMPNPVPRASAPVQKMAGIQPMPRKPRQRFRGIVGRMS